MNGTGFFSTRHLCRRNGIVAWLAMMATTLAATLATALAAGGCADHTATTSTEAVPTTVAATSSTTAPGLDAYMEILSSEWSLATGLPPGKAEEMSRVLRSIEQRTVVPTAATIVGVTASSAFCRVTRALPSGLVSISVSVCDADGRSIVWVGSHPGTTAVTGGDPVVVRGQPAGTWLSGAGIWYVWWQELGQVFAAQFDRRFSPEQIARWLSDWQSLP